MGSSTKSSTRSFCKCSVTTSPRVRWPTCRRKLIWIGPWLSTSRAWITARALTCSLAVADFLVSTAEDFKNTMELWDQDKTGHVEFKNLAAALKSFAGASEEDVVRMRKELKVEGDDFAYGGFVDVMRGVEFVDPKAVK
eukprot:TRINITY_DN4242_c0_g1_i5.p1 TRINITY_DN4242_c0_g1~~TRINITY_DN4242_c0_g1_i5.p1  ORF type:complete len:139 (+),score=18.99 TRINITY_DN4242_c0_g1_i5:115-531(+)